MLKAENITKSFGKKSILKDISLSIEIGEITAIIGPSGSGKTTLLRILCFLDEPDSGHVSFEHNKVYYDSREFRKPWPLITCVFQKQFLWPHLTVRQNIITPLHRLSIKKQTTAINRVVDMFEMEDFLQRYPHQISGGEAQRVSLARAMVLDPTILFLDEAHTFLDMVQQEKLNNYLKKLKNHGVGLCVVSHSLSFVQNQADKIIVLEETQIADKGGKEVIKLPKSKFMRMALGFKSN